MACGMFSCVPQAASQHERKIYNVLVPDVFPLQEPRLDEPVPLSIRRKISKLGEYVEKNPARISKVSRRLTRRIKKSLYERSHGHVKVAVYTYIYLLAKSTDEDNCFSFKYFSKELIQQPDAVIKSLLAYPVVEIQTLGAELLAQFIRSQDDIEHQAEANTDLMASVLELLAASSASSSAATSAPAATGASKQGAPAMGAREELSVACLRAAQEYVRLCHRLRVLPPLLDEVELAMLNCVDGGDTDALVSPGAAAATAGKPGSTEQMQRLLKTIDAAFAGETGVSKAVPQGGFKAAQLALDTLHHLGPFLVDVSTVYRVLQTLFRFLDAGGRWEKPQLVERLLQVLRNACGEQTFPLFAALMRHSSAPGLTPKQRTVIIKLAMAQGSVYSLSGLSLALTELPVVLPAAGGASAEEGALRTASLEAVGKLALEVGDATQLCEAVSSALRAPLAEAQGATSPGAPTGSRGARVAPSLECALEAISVIKGFQSQPARTFVAHTFPGSLLQQLGTIAASWDDEQCRRLAASCLYAVLPCAGSAVRDEWQAQALLALCYALAPAPSSLPADLQAASRMAVLAVQSGRVGVLLHAARLAVTLRSESLQGSGRLSGLSPVRRCSVLLLVHSLTRQLLSACVAPNVSASGGAGPDQGSPASQAAAAADATGAAAAAAASSAAALPAVEAQALQAAVRTLRLASPSGQLELVGSSQAGAPQHQHDESATAVSAANAALDAARRTDEAGASTSTAPSSSAWASRLASALWNQPGGALNRAYASAAGLAADLARPFVLSGQLDAHAGGLAAPKPAGPTTAAPAPVQAATAAAATAWAQQQSSLRRERINLQSVMDMIGDDDDDQEDAEAGGCAIAGVSLAAADARSVAPVLRRTSANGTPVQGAPDAATAAAAALGIGDVDAEERRHSGSRGKSSHPHSQHQPMARTSDRRLNISGAAHTGAAVELRDVLALVEELMPPQQASNLVTAANGKQVGIGGGAAADKGKANGIRFGSLRQAAVQLPEAALELEPVVHA